MSEEQMMELKQAFELVCDLASQNVIDARDDQDDHDRQVDAITLVEKFVEGLARSEKRPGGHA